MLASSVALIYFCILFTFKGDAFSSHSRILHSKKKSTTQLDFIPIGIANTLDDFISEGVRRVRESILHKSNDEFQIREVKIKDLQSIAALRVNVFHPEFCTVASYHQTVISRIKERMEKNGAIVLMAYRNQHGKIARNNKFYGNCVGTVEFSDDFKNTTMQHIGAKNKLYIADLAIREDARRVGLASKLLNVIEEYAQVNDYKELFLHVDKGNDRAYELYRKHGFHPVGQANWATHFTESRLCKDAENFIFLYKIVPGGVPPENVSFAALKNHDVISSSSSSQQTVE